MNCCTSNQIAGDYWCHDPDCDVSLILFADPTPVVSCAASGDAHFTSFDNKRFDYQGDCTYILVQTTGDLREGVPEFRTRLKLGKLHPSHAVSFVQEIYVDVYGYDIRMTIAGLIVSWAHTNTDTYICIHMYSYSCLIASMN